MQYVYNIGKTIRENYFSAIKRDLENKILDKYKEKQQKEKEG